MAARTYLTRRALGRKNFSAIRMDRTTYSRAKRTQRIRRIQLSKDFMALGNHTPRFRS